MSEMRYGYMRGLLENEAEHSRYCNMIGNGPVVSMADQKTVVWAKADDRILLVTNSSSEEQRKLAHDIAQCANHEMHYDCGIYQFNEPPDERQIQIFLYVRSLHAVGICIIEKRDTIWHCAWNAVGSPTCVEQPEKAWMWSVGFIWVHRKYRHTGIAYILFNEAQRTLNLSQDDIGWYTPLSEDGESFVRKVCPIEFFIAK